MLVLFWCAWPWQAACPGGGRGPGLAPAGELLSCGDKKVAKEAPLPRAGPAKLTARLRRYVRTAAGSMNFYFEHARRLRAHAGVVGGWGF